MQQLRIETLIYFQCITGCALIPLWITVIETVLPFSIVWCTCWYFCTVLRKTHQTQKFMVYLFLFMPFYLTLVMVDCITFVRLVVLPALFCVRLSLYNSVYSMRNIKKNLTKKKDKWICKLLNSSPTLWWMVVYKYIAV